MKRFFLFTGSTYYASGGIKDFHGDYDDIDAAIEAGQNACDQDYCDENDLYPDDWWHVFDSKERSMVAGEGFAQS